MSLHEFEIEPEVREWLDTLSASDYKRVDEVAGMLAACGTDMPGSLAKPLGGGVWELRVRIRDGAVAARVTYWFAPGRVVFLTVFRKTRQHEEDEVQRARGARKVCERDHGTAADSYRRTV